MYLRLIDPGPPGRLYVGSCPRTERDLDQLTHESVSTVVTLCRKHPGDVVGRHYGYARSWWYHPLQDGKKLQTDDYFHVARWVAKLLGDGQRVLVHCLAGRNRSCLVAALALRERYDLTGTEAAERVRSARPNALHNEVHLDWLRGLPAPQ